MRKLCKAMEIAAESDPLSVIRDNHEEVRLA